jgi:hypothetical protein
VCVGREGGGRTILEMQCDVSIGGINNVFFCIHALKKSQTFSARHVAYACLENLTLKFVKI